EYPARAVWTCALAVGVPALALAIAVARGNTSDPWVLPLAVITLLAAVVVVTLDLRYGLALFIITAALSPKLPGFYNNLRVEDFVFALVFIGWAGRSLTRGFRIVRSPLLLPFLLLTAFGVCSTIWG